MAMVILFGLLSSTALNMIVVPVVYERSVIELGRTKMPIQKRRIEGNEGTEDS